MEKWRKNRLQRLNFEVFVIEYSEVEKVVYQIDKQLFLYRKERKKYYEKKKNNKFFYDCDSNSFLEFSKTK